MCGIVGIIGSPHSAQEAYQGLLLLQHRGQDAAGILSFDFNQKKYSLHKNQGLIDQVFDENSLATIQGDMSIAHTRYSTVGGLDIKDVQPLTLNYPYGIGLAHNGNLENFQELEEFLNTEKKRFIFTKNDGEILINLLSDHLAHTLKKSGAETSAFDPDIFFNAVSYLFKYAKGGYSVLSTIAPFGLMGFRDPNAIRPLILGKREKDGAYCLTSESIVLDYLGFKPLRDLAPGEVVFIDKDGTLHNKILTQEPKKSCMFEWIYFSNPESKLENQSVYDARLKFGKKLGEKIAKLIEKGEVTPDVVSAVPDTSRIAATSLAETLNIPNRPLLNKNRYIQRSFILNTQDSRENAVRLKLFPIKEDIEGKNVLVVDDSIVRGTTSRRIVKMLRDAGANKVYMASTCPMIQHSCHYGIDFPDPEKLIAYKRSLQEIEREIGCDKAIFLEVEDLYEVLGNDLCTACLTGNYPTREAYASS